MTGQLGQVTLDVAEGEALAGLLGVGETWQATSSTASTMRAGWTVGRLWPRWSRIAFVPTTCLSRAARNSAELRSPDPVTWRIRPKCPVAQAQKK